MVVEVLVEEEEGMMMRSGKEFEVKLGERWRCFFGITMMSKPGVSLTSLQRMLFFQ